MRRATSSSALQPAQVFRVTLDGRDGLDGGVAVDEVAERLAPRTAGARRPHRGSSSSSSGPSMRRRARRAWTICVRTVAARTPVMRATFGVALALEGAEHEGHAEPLGEGGDGELDAPPRLRLGRESARGTRLVGELVAPLAVEEGRRCVLGANARGRAGGRG